MSAEMDRGLMQDFLTEAGELVEQLDADLVKLEEAEPGQTQMDLLNSIFRALHTVKGAAGFLGLDTVITFAHTAEDALNRLRKGEVAVTASVVDSLLASVDVLRQMIEALGAGQAAPPCPEALLNDLRAIVSGAAGGAGEQSRTAESGDDCGQAETLARQLGATVQKLDLPEQKQDLVGFMAADLKESLPQIEQTLQQAANPGSRADAAAHLIELAEPMARTAEFFELPDLCELVKLLGTAGDRLPQISEQTLEELLLRLSAMRLLIEAQSEAMEKGYALSWPLERFRERLELLMAGESLPADVAGKHEGDLNQLLVLDGVLTESEAIAEATAASEQAKADTTVGTQRSTSGAARPAAEQTIRVEVGRLEALLNLVGQMVLTKNRVLAMSRRVHGQDLPQEFSEEVIAVANDLDRLTGNLQVGVMRTRMQPLAKLFDRYPRVIRDIARATDKQINLQIVGKETEVDKSVLELLADPLVHMLRNSADHGVETPEQRKAAEKSAEGTIRLLAEHQGSHVRVEISDDGRGMDRDVIGRKAIEKGLTTPDQLAQMSDEDVFQFIFAAGFSTAAQVSDLSGRGVGMDVVRNNVAKMNGTIGVSSKAGEGTKIEILIPLTVAIMPAMLVGIGRHDYCVPLQSILEIIRLDDQATHTVNGQSMIQVRDRVLPLIDLRHVLGEPATDPARFAVVVAVGGHSVGLSVHRVIGQQEIVIKPLDDDYVQGGPFSGATIRDNGEVSLILDVVQLARRAQGSERTGVERRAA